MNPESQEQLEMIRAWWRENGTSAIIGIVLGGGTVGGWQGWELYQDLHAEAAGEVYQVYRTQMRSADTEAAQASAEELRANYGSTVFAALAGLRTARIHLDAEEPDEAQQWLDWVRSNAPDPALSALATIRLARVHHEHGPHDAGIELLEGWEEEGWEALRQEILGDLYDRAGRPDDAREAYRAAYAAGARHEYLKFKLDRLGVAQ